MYPLHVRLICSKLFITIVFRLQKYFHYEQNRLSRRPPQSGPLRY